MARKPNAIPPKVNGADALEDKEDELVVEGEGELEELLTEAEPDAATESIDSLKAQLEAANQRAEREAAARIDAEKRVNNAGMQVADSNLAAIDNAINSAVSDKKNLLAEITAAKEAGDYAKEVEALDKLQATNIKLNRLGEGKSELERRIEEQREYDEQQRDPLEGYIAGAKLNAVAASWVRSHPDVLVTNGRLDSSKLDELNTAHLLAVSKRNGLVQGSPEYFAFIENELLGDGQEQEEEPAIPAPKPNGSRAPAARPSRTPSPTNASSSIAKMPSGVSRLSDGSYRLSAERREAARISGLSDAEYLKNLLAIEREGQLTH